MRQGKVSFEETVDAFGGIDRRGVGGKPDAAWEMCNFRVAGDGSLCRREGYAPFCQFEGQVRGVWSGYLDGCDVILAVAGNGLYRVVELAGSAAATKLFSLTTTAGKVMFFYLDGYVYLMDGAAIYSYDGTTVGYANCYAPLYGKLWDPTRKGAVNEELNAFSRCVRISYKTALTTSTLTVGMKIAAVDGIFADNTSWLDASQYSISEDGLSVNLTTSYASGHLLLVYLRLASEAMQDTSVLTSCNEVTIYGGEFDDRVFLYHGSSAADIYYSHRVSEEQMAECRAVWTGQSNLYFTMGQKITVGGGCSEVTGLCRHYDRLLIFRHDGASMASLADGKVPDAVYPTMPVNSTVGCVSPEAIALYGNDPVTVCEKGIFRWRQTTDERDECNAVCISEKVAKLPFLQDVSGVYSVAWYTRGEVWFYKPGDTQGQVLVCAPGRGIWYLYDGIYAGGMFLFRDEMCFYGGTSLYRFSSGNAADTYGGEAKSIVGKATFPALEVGSATVEKRLMRVYLTCGGGGSWQVKLKTDRGIEDAFTVAVPQGSERTLETVRLSAGRFVHGALTLTASGSAGQRLYGMTIRCGS